MRCAEDCDHQNDCAYQHNAKRCEEDAMFREAVDEWKYLYGAAQRKEKPVDSDSDT